MPAARLAALKTVAQATVANPNLFHPLGGVEETVTSLKTIRGIGKWTTQYIALRAVREPDAFPARSCVTFPQRNRNRSEGCCLAE